MDLKGIRLGGKSQAQRCKLYLCLCELLSCLVALSRVRLFVALCTAARQAPLSVAFLRQEYWSGLPFPSPGNHPNPGIEPRSPALQADSLPAEPSEKFR